MHDPSPEREAQARAFAAAIAAASQEQRLASAHTLRDAEPAARFGAPKVPIRDRALKIAAKAYEPRLAQKTTATTDPA